MKSKFLEGDRFAAEAVGRLCSGELGSGPVAVGRERQLYGGPTRPNRSLLKWVKSRNSIRIP